MIAPVDVIFGPIILVPGKWPWDGEALYHIAPAEAVFDDDGDGPMSDVTPAAPIVSSTEVAAFEPHAPA